MRLGFIGVGNMGFPMARNLATAGHELTVFDLNKDATGRLADYPGVEVAPSAAAVADGASIVFTSLPGPPQVEDVILGGGGLADAFEAGTLYVDLSTNSPTLVRRIAAELKTRGIDMLDCPVAGGVEGAESGTLSIMVGGDELAFERARPLLETIGSKVFYCGESGNGCVVKICNNLCGIAHTMILGEALTLGVKAGVDLATLTSAIGQSTGSSTRLTNRLPQYLFRRNFTPGFAAALSFKDTSLALALGDELGVPLQLATKIRDEMQQVLDRGWGDLDFDVIARLQEERAGVTLELPSNG